MPIMMAESYIETLLTVKSKNDLAEDRGQVPTMVLLVRLDGRGV